MFDYFGFQFSSLIYWYVRVSFCLSVDIRDRLYSSDSPDAKLAEGLARVPHVPPPLLGTAG